MLLFQRVNEMVKRSFLEVRAAREEREGKESQRETCSNKLGGRRDKRYQLIRHS